MKAQLCPDCLGQKGHGSIVDGWSECERCNGSGAISEGLPEAPGHEIRLGMDTRYNPVALSCSCGYVPKNPIAAIDIDPETDLVMHIAMYTRGATLLNRDITPEERKIEALAPRPGWFWGNLRFAAPIDPSQHNEQMLTQAQTDATIVHELREWYTPLEEREELGKLAAPFLASPRFERQIGGIHSDPFVRVLAFRAWGRRDLDWVKPEAEICRDEYCLREEIHPKHTVRRGAMPTRPMRDPEPTPDELCSNCDRPTGHAGSHDDDL